MIAVLHLWQLFGGECFYCGIETWVEHHESKVSAMARLGVQSATELRKRKATREHLRRKADDGGNDVTNLALACNQCNGSRQSTPVLLHLAHRRQPKSAPKYMQWGDVIYTPEGWPIVPAWRA